ncbi:HD-GYP domain-containing protein [Labrys monachus]|uniref:HD-GYP domain-containing protein (C-di-GMP phosphodiesterase class II) n=1 Tax=Labrys monachus TaxID=217067 RepID=A0ABU0FFU6_9HYPH|nr:HD domain-containing phosphohydrolase [Labrys monachus]MDQ0393478.1 HD-GYP domain-containing protein (c-di-GMP phosphodiesterase class II) [Labrys monachus]
MGHLLVVVHDRPDGRPPVYVPALSSIGTVLTVDLSASARLRAFIDAPWLIDIVAPNESKVARLRAAMSEPGGAPRLLVVTPEDHLTRVQANALGATAVVPRPITVETIRRLLDHPQSVESGVDTTAATDVVTAIAGAADALDQVFSACVAGASIDAAVLRRAATLVSPVVREAGLGTWLDLVRRHHTGTYLHILQVMGISVLLGQRLSLGATEIDRLALSALLHDTGKCWTPEAILDKPGKLTEAEFTIMRRHSYDGWAALRATDLNLDEDVYDAVLHHHEHLDGSGYPDSLVGATIRPLTRILTVCDIFGALIERRAYRPPLPPLEALTILEAMALAGKVDGTLVGALFRLAISRESRLRQSTSLNGIGVIDK